MPPAIRLATLDDAEPVQAIYAPYCHTPISFESEPPSVADIRGRLAKVLAHFPWLQRVFHTAPIGPSEWLFVFAWTPVLFVADELRKALLRGSKKRFKPRGSGSLESVGRVSLS